jgi:hypothetical protein
MKMKAFRFRYMGSPINITGRKNDCAAGDKIRPVTK